MGKKARSPRKVKLPAPMACHIDKNGRVTCVRVKVPRKKSKKSKK